MVNQHTETTYHFPLQMHYSPVMTPPSLSASQDPTPPFTPHQPNQNLRTQYHHHPTRERPILPNYNIHHYSTLPSAVKTRRTHPPKVLPHPSFPLPQKSALIPQNPPRTTYPQNQPQIPQAKKKTQYPQRQPSSLSIQERDTYDK